MHLEHREGRKGDLRDRIFGANFEVPKKFGAKNNLHQKRRKNLKPGWGGGLADPPTLPPPFLEAQPLRSNFRKLNLKIVN